MQSSIDQLQHHHHWRYKGIEDIMHSSRSAARSIWRAAAASSRAGGSTSAQVIIPRRFAMPATSSSSRSSLFSTSSWQLQQSEATKEKKMAENEVGGEIMGATDEADPAAKAEAVGGGGTSADDALQKTIKEKDARIKELSVSVLDSRCERCPNTLLS
jgi:hypothetical protein